MDRPAAAVARGADLLTTLRARFGEEPIRHIEHLPARDGRYADWPAWVPNEIVAAFGQRGIARPWAHQAEAAEMAHRGEHVVISTGTASGKSLGYQLPLLATLLTGPRACALYLSPTKALAADQRESLQALPFDELRVASYDGDTPRPDRDWARKYGRYLLTNPDMLHLGIVANHERWSRVIRNLRYVVVDECHAYRGVFGSHVALILRRLRRVAASYGADPTFIMASATVADPAHAAERLIGAPVRAVTDDAAPHAGADFVLWDPAAHGTPGRSTPDTSNEPPEHLSASTEAAKIMATLVDSGARTLTFIRSRAGAEYAAVVATSELERANPALADTVSSYRGGYLPEDRRALERAFETGELLGVSSTNALELGVDISGVDAAVLAGYPGSLASLWQQAGRAGRAETAALVVFVARDDPLDSYLIHHPEAVFGRSIEAAVIDPGNPHVLGPHLACAAAEAHLTDADLALFGSPHTQAVIDGLIATKVLRRRPNGYFYAGDRHPAGEVNLRGSGKQVALVERDTGRLLGTEDAARAPSSVHPAAVYLHQGKPFVVHDLDLEAGVATLAPDHPDWWTSPRGVSSIEVLDISATRHLTNGVTVTLGDVCVTERVTGYARRRSDGTLIDVTDLDMPEHTLDTTAVWYTIGRDRLTDAGLAEQAIPGALHAAEHAAIGLLPLFAGCDRSDIGGLSTALHADTGEPTVFVYDGVPGGAGFAERGYGVLGPWLTAVRDAVAACPCEGGCPSCIQSPKCGNGNEPLDKAGAVMALGIVISALDHAVGRPHPPRACHNGV